MKKLSQTGQNGNTTARELFRNVFHSLDKIHEWKQRRSREEGAERERKREKGETEHMNNFQLFSNMRDFLLCDTSPW